jgi:hypothetical protein
MALQIEPGGQTEQVSPTGVIRLGPKDLAPFHYLTVSVTCHLAVSGRPPPSAIMAVGQFFNPEKETKSLSAAWLLSSLYKQQVLSPPPATAPLAVSHFHWSIQTRQGICIYKYIQANLS